jgi:glycosyltransferase involved in cell wall biosynthesis
MKKVRYNSAGILKEKVLLVGHLFPDHLESKIFGQLIPPIQTQRFGMALLTALSKGFNGEIDTISVAPILDFPKCKMLISPGSKWVPFDGVRATMIPFMNILGVKHLTRFIGTFLFVGLWSIRNIRRKRIIVMHGVQSCKIWGVLLGQALYPAITIPYLTDNIGIPLAWENRLIKKLRSVDVAIMKAGIKKVTGVISMTKALAHILAPGRPSIILPAIQNISIELAPVSSQKVDENHSSGRTISVVYAGGLYRDSGIDLLAESFCRAKWADKKLIIFGTGELESTIRAYSRKNSNILYMGFIDPKKMDKVYAAADILINPRRISTLISLQSFPSKLVEYVCTGKPVISTNMPALNDDFKKHLMIAYADEPEEIIRCIEEVSSWDSNKRDQWRMQVIEYVKKELAPEVQGTRIREFVQRLDASVS